MPWIITTIIGILVLFWVIARMPLRRLIALNRATQRACNRKDYDTAIRLCGLSHKAAERLREPARLRVQSKIEIQWATLLYRQGRIRQAEDLFHEGFTHARAAGSYPELRPAYLVWGDLCTDEGRHLEAEQHYRTAIAGEEQIGNMGSMIFDLQRLGDSLIRQGRRQAAEEVIQRAIVLETQVVHEQMTRDGKNPSQHRVISWSLPDLHFCREQYEDARRLYREKVEFWEKSVTRPDNINLGHLQMRLALSEERTGHRADAIEMYTRAEKTFEREWGETHPKVNAAREAKDALMRQVVNQ